MKYWRGGDGKHMAAICINDGTVLEGELPKKALEMVVEWNTIHKVELLKIWVILFAGDGDNLNFASVIASQYFTFFAPFAIAKDGLWASITTPKNTNNPNHAAFSNRSGCSIFWWRRR